MAHDFFEQLAEAEVPPVPARLDSQFRRRLNQLLLVTQLFDFTLKAMPYAAGHFIASVVHLIRLTVAGPSEPGPRQEPKQP